MTLVDCPLSDFGDEGSPKRCQTWQVWNSPLENGVIILKENHPHYNLVGGEHVL